MFVAQKLSKSRGELVMKFSMKSVALILFLCVCMFSTGCASLMFQTKGEQVHEFKVTGTNYEVAYNKALKSVTDLGFSVFQSDKASGTFYASRGNGYSEISEFNFMLERSGKKLTATIRIKSNQPDQIREEFIRAYRRYVKVDSVS